MLSERECIPDFLQSYTSISLFCQDISNYLYAIRAEQIEDIISENILNPLPFLVVPIQLLSLLIPLIFECLINRGRSR